MVLDNARDAEQVRSLLPGAPRLPGGGDQPRPAHRAGRRRRAPVDRRTCSTTAEARELLVGRLGARPGRRRAGRGRRDHRAVRPAAAGAGRGGRPRRDLPDVRAGRAGRANCARHAAASTSSPAPTRPPTPGPCSRGPTSSSSDRGRAAVPAARPARRSGYRHAAPRPASPACRSGRCRPLLAELARAHLRRRAPARPVRLPRSAARLRVRAGTRRRHGRRPARGDRRCSATTCTARTRADRLLDPRRESAAPLPPPPDRSRALSRPTDRTRRWPGSTPSTGPADAPCAEHAEFDAELCELGLGDAPVPRAPGTLARRAGRAAASR